MFEHSNPFQTFQGADVNDVTAGTFSDVNAYNVNVPLDIKAASPPVKAGRALLKEYFDKSGDAWVMQKWAKNDSWPLPVLSCRKSSEIGHCEFNESLSCSRDSDCGTTGHGVSDVCNLGEGIGLEIVSDSFITTVCDDQKTYEKYPSEAQYTGGTENILKPNDSPWFLSRAYEDLDPEDEDEAFNGNVRSNAIGGLGNSKAVKTGQQKPSSFSGMLSQFFAKTVGDTLYFAWNESTGGTGKGAYKPTESNEVAKIKGDISERGDAYGLADADKMAPVGKRAPTIAAVGECRDGECLEGDKGAFNVGAKTSGIVSGQGFQHVQVSFFVYANPNQLPLRNIVVDWGDGDWKADQVIRWPNDSYSGSKSDDNFYKNHRGYAIDDTGKQTEICTRNSAWGETAESCDTSFRAYEYDYRCSQIEVDQLAASGRACKVDMTTGKPRLINSPCTGSDNGKIPGGEGKCVFQPRVHASDNWGYCTGECLGIGDFGQDECYDGSGISLAFDAAGRQLDNECNIKACPGNQNCRFAEIINYPKTDGLDAQGSISRGSLNNPWINFNGFVLIEP